VTRAWVAAALVVAGCSLPGRVPVRRAYVLHLDASQPERSTRCELDDAPLAAGEKPVEKECVPWKGGDLSPGSMSIDLTGQEKGVGYDVHVSQTVREANPDDVKAVLDKVVERIFNGLTKKAGELTKSVDLERVLDAAAESAPKLTAALRDRLAAEEVQPRPTSAAIFKGFVSGGALLMPAARSTGGDVDYNGPLYSVPARVYVLTDDDLAYLVAHGVDEAKTRTWVESWCNVASFQADADHTARQAALKDAATPDVLLDALGIAAGDLGRMLVGRSSTAPLDARLNALLEESKQPWASVGASSKTFYLMRIGTGLSAQLSVCAANLARVGAAVPADLTTLQNSARAHAAAFAAALGAIVGQELAVIERDAEANTDGQFGVFELAAGDITVELGATRANTRQLVATYKADILGMERFALVIGPMGTMCRSSWACFDTFSQYSDGRGQFIVRNRDRFDVSFATALHVTVASWDRTAVGLVVGYPIGTPGPTSYNVLAGVGLRLRAGLEVAIGLHAFRTPVLRGAYDKTPLRLFENDWGDLTVAEITEDRWRAGGFLMIGFDPSLFSKLTK